MPEAGTRAYRQFQRCQPRVLGSERPEPPRLGAIGVIDPAKTPVRATVALASLLACALLLPACVATTTDGTTTPEQPAVTRAPQVSPGSSVSPTESSLDTSAVDAAQFTAPSDLTPAAVTRITDGDTIRVRVPDGSEIKVRLIGVDTPEVYRTPEPFGAEASAFTKAHLPVGSRVWLEFDTERFDRYGRTLAYVWTASPDDRSDAQVREKMFNAQLALDGYASQMTIPPNVAYAENFSAYVREAREAQRGLWAR